MGLRPLRVGEILDAAIKLYTRNARTLIGLAACVAVPLNLLVSIILMSTFQQTQEHVDGLTYTSLNSSAVLGGSVAILALTFIAGPFVTAASVRAISQFYLDQPASIGESLAHTRGRIFAVLGLALLYIGGLILATVCLIVPGIYFYFAWIAAYPAMMVEGLRPRAALSRSRGLVKGRWWSVAGTYLCALIMLGVVQEILRVVLDDLVLGSDPSIVAIAVGDGVIGIISMSFIQPFMAAVTTVLYYDLRVRQEGYDVELIATQLGLPPSELPPAPGSPHVGGWGPETIGTPGGPPFWPPPPSWSPPSDPPAP